MYFFRDCLFLALPCGCIAECEELSVFNAKGIDYIECYWCGMSVERDAMRDWLNSEIAPEIHIQNPAPDLIRVRDRVLEIVGQHNCGAPLVREPGAREAFHLVPDGIVEMLRD